jgi:hypothetical protein
MKIYSTTLHKVLKRGIYYNLAASFLLIGLFITWEVVGDSLWNHNQQSGDLEFLEDIDAGNRTHIDKNTVVKTTRGKAIFRTARMLPVKTVDVLGRFDFKGISNRNGILRAYIKDMKLKKTYPLKEGDQFGGVYTVLEIQRNAIIVERGNDRWVLEK